MDSNNFKKRIFNKYAAMVTDNSTEQNINNKIVDVLFGYETEDAYDIDHIRSNVQESTESIKNELRKYEFFLKEPRKSLEHLLALYPDISYIANTLESYLFCPITYVDLCDFCGSVNTSHKTLVLVVDPAVKDSDDLIITCENCYIKREEAGRCQTKVFTRAEK